MNDHSDHTAEERVLKSCPEVIRTKLRWDIEKFSLVCPKDASDAGVNFRSIDSSEQLTKIELGNATASASDGVEKKTEIEIKWILKLLFFPSNQQQDQGRNQCRILLQFSPSSPPACPSNWLPKELWSVGFKVSVIGQGNAVVLTRSVTSLKKLMNYSEVISPPDLLPIDSSELWANEQTHIVNDTLQLQVELAFCQMPQTKELSAQCQALASHVDDLVAGMAQLWKSGKDSDLTISCRDKVFNVHSGFVKCRSPVLERMLESGMIESAKTTIKIDEVDPADFEALLEYLYTGKLPEPGEGAAAAASPFIGLMQVADKYEVLKLRDYCFQKMIEYISMQNAGQIAVFTHLHSAPAHVKNAAVNFCLRNWKTLSQDVNFNAWTLQNPAAFLPGRGTQ